MSKMSSLSLILALLVAMLGGATTYTPAKAASRLYVVLGGSGTCTGSWGNACGLQTALANAVAGDEIWVKAETYRPDLVNRAVSFNLKAGVAVYGGFDGTEINLSERDPNPATNGTILSGDLTGNDPTNNDNSYHVVSAINTGSSTTLDGFTIRGGNANAASPHNVGGGMYSKGGGATLANLIFSGNTGSSAGALFNDTSSPKLTNVTFLGNSAVNEGGAISNNFSNPTLTNVTFSDNSTNNWGGGALFNYNSSPVLNNVTFFKNTAGGNGGGMYNGSNSNSTLNSVTFTENTASSGGGMHNDPGSAPVLNSVTFSGNSAPYGGGMRNLNSSPALTNVDFLENSATNEGGGMFNSDGSNPSLTNVIFSQNSSSVYGGGMMNRGNSNPTLLNVTFSSNTAGINGGGMNNVDSSPKLTSVTFSGNSTSNTGGGMFNTNANPTLLNVIFVENSSPHGGGLMNWGNSQPTITNATFSGNTASFYGGGMNNTNSSPKLTNVTFSNNSATNTGGGMYTTNGSPIVQNVTFSGNTAGVKAGGVYYLTSNLKLTNVIITNSTTNNIKGGDCVSESILIGSFFNNLIEDPINICGLANGVNGSGNIVGVAPSLGPLADNGGPTQTHALLAGSPAIDKGTNVNCPATDQRGVTRPQGSQCDIGAYESRNLTISGNAGRAGVTLSYSDGIPKAVTSIGNGNYSIPILEGWSGTVTPTQTCFTFTPPNKNYSNITENQTQNYSATLQSTCAEVTVRIGQTPRGTYALPANSGQRLSYAVDSGPMFVHGTGKTNVGFVASQRFIQKGTSTPLHFSEMMGLPDNLKSTRYVFPAYDNFFFNSQLRIANVGTANTIVTVRVGGVLKGSHPLGPNQGTKISYAGLSGGPVVVQSSNSSVPIIASLRVATIPYNGSYSEMIGLPQSLVGTSYIFPWYNNVAPLDTQLRVGNVGAAPTTVTVRVGTTVVGTIPLAVGEGKRVNYPANGGPMTVTSSGNVQIVASLRVAFRNGSTFTSFSEVMGLPQSQQDTIFLFPWYNNQALDSQLRFANMSGATASVRIYIGGVQMPGSPFTLPAGVSTRQSFDFNNGPVRIVSNRPIVASMRVVFKNGNTFTSFSEMMGLPQKQLTNKYIFPWYNNLTLDTQLRLGVP